MNYAVKYDLLHEVMNKSKHKCEIYTYDLRRRHFYWENTNKLLNRHFVAAKTGITPSAGPCLISCFQFGEYQSLGCLIDCKSAEIRWKEMATILLWHFDQYLKKSKLGAYNRTMVVEFQKRRQKLNEEREAKAREDEQAVSKSPEEEKEVWSALEEEKQQEPQTISPTVN